MDRITESKKRILEYVSLRCGLVLTGHKEHELIQKEREIYKVGLEEMRLWNEAVKSWYHAEKQKDDLLMGPLLRVFTVTYRSDLLELNEQRALDGGLTSMLEAYDAGVPVKDIIA